MKDPFTSDEIQGPSNKLEASCSIFKLSGISHDDVKKNSFMCPCRVKQKSGIIH
jgi:hypothetical protein